MLASLELQKDEAEDTQSEQEETFMSPSLEDPELNINHPYYDIARHGIIQLAGMFGKYYGFILLSLCHIFLTVLLRVMHRNDVDAFSLHPEKQPNSNIRTQWFSMGEL